MQLQFGSVLILAARGQREKLDEGVTIIHLPKGSAPFSFLRWIFINPEECCSSDLEEILHHERAHVSQLHTFDVLFSELLCAVCWINPFIWLLRNAIRENLEYLADRKVIRSGFNQKSYQYHLLRLSAQQTTSTMGNYFNVSQLKKRIVMMNKKKSSLAGLGKYALSLPIFALLLLSSNVCSAKSETASGSTIITKDNPLDTCEQMPEFPGGKKALSTYLTKNRRHPKSEAFKQINGLLIAQFIINKTGDVTDVKVVKGLDPAFDAETVRIVRSMPKWKPGKQNGRNVSVYYKLPIFCKTLEFTAAKISKVAAK
jgi:hypothetical protein